MKSYDMEVCTNSIDFSDPLEKIQASRRNSRWGPYPDVYLGKKWLKENLMSKYVNPLIDRNI